ncbi:glutamate-1-semialdehyde 2,1-aminomutase [Cordyceps javanica]|nr:glutamate-1-semialdehyde 2,1-aminomutase [Cordyceps javanica]
MDSRGSFDMNAYMRMIEGAKAAHLKARQYEGKKVLPWPAREQVIARFMTGLIRMEAQRSSISTSTAILPVYYLPCIFPSAELKPIFISDLTLETHHRGCKILLRVCTEICRMTGLWMIAEDEYGAAISLHLQHQPEEKVISARELLRKGTILLLKEPYFKRASDGEHVLRVDHVSDIIWLQGQDVRIPFAWKPQNIGFDSTKARLAGDNYVRKSKLAIASAQTPLDSGLAYYSRSHVNLLLGRPSSALDDVVAMKSKLEPTENGIFREAICLYKLKKFDQCYSKLQELRLLYPNNEKVQSEIVKATAKLRECNEGIYDWKDMHRQAKNSPPLVDCGTFSRNVEVRQSPGKGRGLFTAKAVAVGELLLCEKAFAYCGLDKDAEQKETILLDINTTKILTTGQTGLLSRVVQNLYHEPEMAASFLDLHDGGHPTPQKDLQVDSKPVVDTYVS